MRNMNIKLIFADVDGTLIEPTTKEAPYPSTGLVQTVKQLHDKGIIFCLATARSLSSVINLVEGLQLAGPVIFDNGARIYDCREKKYLKELYLGKDKVEAVERIIKEIAVNEKMIIVDDNERLTEISRIKKWKVTKMIVLGIYPELADRLYNKLSAIKGIAVTKSISGSGGKSESIHITDSGATKANGVNYIAGLLNVKKNEIMGIGDSYNDLEMLLACGLKVAMGNSIPRILKIADYIAPDYANNGVVETLKKIVLENATMSNHMHDLSGERKDQKLQLTDQTGTVIGCATREECHMGDGKTHLAFMALLINKDGNFILTKRSGRKSLWANFWDASIVSHVLPGETVVEAAKRRCREELGIDADFTDLGAFVYREKHGDSSENEYCHVLTGRTEDETDPNPVEISGIKPVTGEELKRDIKIHTDKYTPWLKLAVEKSLI